MFILTHHAKGQAAAKGLSIEAVLEAANDPSVTYANGRFAGQMRHIRGGIVAVVDPAKRVVITVYANVVETDARADQTDADARAYALKRARRQGR